MNVSLDVHADPRIAREVRDLALEGYEPPGKLEFGVNEKFVLLRETGSRLWLDTGNADDAQRIWSQELEALTTNNTLINQVVQTGAMDGLITYTARKLREKQPEMSDKDLLVETAFLLNAKIALDLVKRFGAHVSVELHPDLGSNIEGILTFARRYYEINPDFFYIKVPLTPDGFVAVRKLSEEGIPVNFTLGFSARQNYLATNFSRPKFVNVFLGRLNQLVEENGIGKPENVGERAALASDEVVQAIRASQPEIPTQQIAASIRSGSQLPTLAGIDVLTIPPKAADEYLAMEVTKEDLFPSNWRDLPVDINEEYREKFAKLWELNQQFISFTEHVVRQADAVESGADLVAMAQRLGVELFYEWTEEDRGKIRKKGKIPDVSAWPDVPIDELMSVAALESFAKDQMELDARIRGLITQSL